MNRHGYHNEYEYEEEGNVEMPLPTYEEVVGASIHNVGFKGDLLAAGSSSQGGRGDGSDEAARQRTSASRTRNAPNCRRKNRLKIYIVFMVGLIAVPLVILFVVVLLQTCSSSCVPVSDTERADVKLHREELKICKVHLQRTEKRCDVTSSELNNIKEERDELLLKQRSTDDILKALRYRYNTALSDANNMRAEVDRLKKEIEKCKTLATSAHTDLNAQNDT